MACGGYNHHLLIYFLRKKRGKRILTGPKTPNDKVGKGLRHFSMKVCEKVQQKGTTSYNEVYVNP